MCKKCKDAGLPKHSDEIRVEAPPERHLGKKRKAPIQPRQHRIACRDCGITMGHVETIGGPWSQEWVEAVSQKFGMKWPLCKPCLARRAARALA